MAPIGGHRRENVQVSDAEVPAFVRRAGDRFHTKLGSFDSRHSSRLPVASGRGHGAAIATRPRDAVLCSVRPGRETVAVPDARRADVFVAAGRVGMEGAGQLESGDAVRLTKAGSPLLVADDALEVPRC
jgi:hypothetical protein